MEKSSITTKKFIEIENKMTLIEKKIKKKNNKIAFDKNKQDNGNSECLRDARRKKILTHNLEKLSDSVSMIDLRRIRKIYQTEAGPFVALKGIDLQIKKGEFVAVVGKSGSGKSTLINMVTGIDHPSDGEVIIADTQIYQLDEGKMAEWRGKNMGIVFQFFQLLPTLTVKENILIPMDLARKYDENERIERALCLLEQFDILDYADKFPNSISQGHSQRAAIARALANDPPILVADEPTGNLDSKTADVIFGLFEKLIENGKTILMVTHDDGLASKAHRKITIADGLIIDEVKYHSDS
jgi:putative ABC transport system ATP-binding protein